MPALGIKFFSKKEFIWVILILVCIGAASLFNLRGSLRRARDLQRKNDVRALADALVKYSSDFGSFPLSQDGKIVACKGDKTQVDKKGNISGLVPCGWGKDSLRDIFDLSYAPYLEGLPDDPLAQKGRHYTYFSNDQRFQIYASLEGADEDEYDPGIVARNISCGAKICNFGLGYGSTPLDKSLEEYENELLKNK